MGKYVCTECGSDKIQVRKWVDPNTDSVIDWADDGDCQCWCGNCEEITPYEYKEDEPPQTDQMKHITATIEMDVNVFEGLTDEELEGSIYWNLIPHLEEMQVTTEGYKIKNFDLKIDTE